MTAKQLKYKKTLLVVNALIIYFVALNLVSAIKNIPETQILEKNVVMISEFSAKADQQLALVDGNKLVLKHGEGLKEFSAPVTLSEGVALYVQFTASLPEESAGKTLYVDLFQDENYDNNANQLNAVLKPGENLVSGTLPFGDTHPDACNLRIFTADDINACISDIQIDRLEPFHGITTNIAVSNFFLIIFMAVFITLILWVDFKIGKESKRTLDKKVGFQTLEQKRGKIFKAFSSDSHVALGSWRCFSQVQWILLGTSIILLVIACIFIFTGGNLWFHSDSAACVNQAVEQIRTGKVFPNGWYGSTGLPWLDIPLFFTIRIIPDWLIARNWAQIIFLVLCLISIVVFSRKVFYDHCWLLIVPVLLMFVSIVQYDMMYLQCAYTFCIIAIFLVLSSFFDAVTISDNYPMRSKRRFSVFLIALFAMSLGGIFMIQQITFPLLGALFILYARKYMEHKTLCPPQMVKFFRVIVAILFSSGLGYICSKFLYEKINISGNMGLTQLAPNLESIIQNINTSILGFLLYIGFQQGNFIFSLTGIQTLLRLFFMVAFTIIFPIIACKNFKDLCKQMQFFILFVLLHCLEVYTILIFGVGADIAGSARYQLTSITLLNTVSCIYIYNKYIKYQRLISYIYTLVVVCVALISTLPILNMGNYPEQLAQMRGLTTYLEQNNLSYGYSTFWNAGKNTVLSNGRVQINAVNISNGQLYKYLWFSSDNWYDPNNYVGKTFILLAPDEVESYAPTGYRNTFLGEPDEILNYEAYTILVYDYNISSYQFGAEFDGDTEYIWKMNCSDQAMPQPDGSVQILEGQLMYGPYIDLGQGVYTLLIDVDCQTTASLNITSESGAKTIASFPLNSGENIYKFELPENTLQVEFTVRGIPNEIIKIKSIQLLY